MCVHVIHVSMPGGWEAQYAVHTHEQWVGEKVCVRVCVCGHCRRQASPI